jgi:hypothetical protein
MKDELSIIFKILKRKRFNIDITETEKIKIKEYLRELKMPGEQVIIAEIQKLFPLEYGEWLDEDEREWNNDIVFTYFNA